MKELSETGSALPEIIDQAPQAPQFIITVPEYIRSHVIQDHELDSLIDIGRQTSLGFACTAVGALLGFIPSILEGVERVSKGTDTPKDVAIIAISFGCFLMSIIFGFSAARSERDVRRLKAEIRSRSAHTWPQANKKRRMSR